MARPCGQRRYPASLALPYPLPLDHPPGRLAHRLAVVWHTASSPEGLLPREEDQCSSSRALRTTFCAPGSSTGCAPGGETISYKALAGELDPDGSLGWNDGGDYRGLSHALFHIATFEVEHGRPVGLVALAPSLEELPDGGFAGMARRLLFDVPEDAGDQKRFWTLKLAEATLYWTEAHENGPMPDAQFDAIMAELSKIKQMIRQLQHG